MTQNSKAMLVSVIMPVFNGRLGYLEKSITSVLSQSYRNIEVIIVDDSDKQEQKDFLAKTGQNDSRVVYVHNNRRLGFVKSLNKALSLAKGDYIARADSDDIQELDRFRKQVDFLEDNRDIGIVGTAVWKIDEHGQKKGVRKYPTGLSVNRVMTIKNAIAHGSVMMRKDVLREIGNYNELFEKAEDYEMWMRAMKRKVKITNLEEPLVYLRMSNVEKRDTANWRNNLVVKYQYFAFNYVLCRVAGIIMVGLMVVFPSFLKRFAYSLYNKLV